MPQFSAVVEAVFRMLDFTISLGLRLVSKSHISVRTERDNGSNVVALDLSRLRKLAYRIPYTAKIDQRREDFILKYSFGDLPTSFWSDYLTNISPLHQDMSTELQNK
ncbi:hypothetical protein C5167_051013 [Papaver somniferum]|uniref:Uncharacterized protein n=1 Tax=Papaver somniferum TaxID=3469 RepID=A0A4Y7KRS5_PAPSO|nr:hypothetical protein C5167_051013 [Papaver somniferum]